MSGHHARPGPRPRHTPHPAIRATVTAIILLAVGACTTTASTATPVTSASPLATVSAGSGGHAGTLTGPARRSSRRSSPWPSPGTSSSIPQ